MIAAVLVIVAGLATAGALVFVNRGGDEQVAEDATYVIMDQPAVSTQPVFQARDARGPDPFFPLETQLATFQTEQSTDASAGSAEGDGDDPGGGSADTASADDFDVAALEADVKTGLYGGTAENTCDPERLIAFLLANPDLGEAWAQVQGITFAQLPSYIRSLEVRVLAEPVAVLNHGYNSNTRSAYEIESTLDAGTAVLVDENGDIRTRCYCGNPIRPKPPTGHKPPGCLVLPGAVFVEPGSSRRRLNNPATIFLTNRAAELGEQAWVEIMWGANADQMGWTRATNVKPTAYCRPSREVPKCPTAIDTPVYSSPTSERPFGQLGVSTVFTAEGISMVNGLVEPVGGGERTVVNGRLLVKFGHPTKPQNAGWVDLSAVDEQSSPEDCEPIRLCVSLDSAKLPNGEGPTPGVSAGLHRVEVTGRIVDIGLEEDAETVQTMIEVRLLEHGNRLSWLDNDDTSARPDAECEPARITLCKRGDSENWANQFVLRNPTTNPFDAIQSISDRQDAGEITPAEAMAEFDAVDVGNVAGFAGDVDVVLIGSPQPTNGYVQVQVAGTGPIGWVPVESLDGDACVPFEICAQFDQPVFSTYRDAGGTLPGTPMASPQLVRVWQAAGIEWPGGSVLGALSFDFDDVRLLVEIGGNRGWATPSSIVPIFDQNGCEPMQPECPPQAVTTAPPEAPDKNCCVSINGEYQFVSLTGESRPGPDGSTEIEVVGISGSPTWVNLSYQVLDAGSACQPTAGCPETQGGPSAVAATDELNCCVTFQTEGELTFVATMITGEMATLGDEVLYATPNGDPVPESRFVPSSFCDDPPEDECSDQGLALDDGSCEPVSEECPEGETQLADGSCEPTPPPEQPCPSDQSRVNGVCQCPVGQEPLADGSCRTPPVTECGPNQERLADGSCRDRPATCRADQVNVGGECRCPDGQEERDGVCQTPPPTCTGDQTLQNGECRCPSGSVAVAGSTQCEVRCEYDNYVAGDDGVCRCPEGQLTLIPNKCCPANLEPDGLGQCLERCPANTSRNTSTGACDATCPGGLRYNPATGQCEDVTNCPPGQIYDTGLEQCVTDPSCPTGQIYNPATGDCEIEQVSCPSGEEIASDGECCPTVYPNSIGWILVPGSRQCIPTSCPTGQIFNIQIYACEFVTS